MGSAQNGVPMATCGDVAGPSGSSSSMVDSFGQAVWEYPMNSAPLGFGDMNVTNGANTCDPLTMLKGDLFLPNMPGALPHSLFQCPTDSGFIERAARFSSFSGGQIGDILNPFGSHQQINSYLQGGAVMQGPQELLSGNSMKPVSSKQSQQSDANETCKEVSLPRRCKSIDGNSFENETTTERQGVSGNDSDEPEISGGKTPEGRSSAKLGAKKRKRPNKGAEPEKDNGIQQDSGKTGKNCTETEQKVEQNSTPPSKKSNTENGKQNSQASDPPEEDYIHIRAKRGQATNSHSLAERIRREKISERMKFLQDLVPGCNKVTGKAVMLDEIINYVQSLQRQVEFLSMKLATVNPRLDHTLEQLLAKDPMFAARAGPSSSLGLFSSDMHLPYPMVHPSQYPMLQQGLPGIGNSSDVLRRAISSQLNNLGVGYKEPSPQTPNVWEDELHNVMQMGFSTSAPVENQETNTSAIQSDES